jgi:hypothetical protein
VRILLRDGPVQKPETADGLNTAGEGITEKKQEPEHRTEKIKSLVYVA